MALWLMRPVRAWGGKDAPVEVPAGAGDQLAAAVLVHEHAAGIAQLVIAHHLEDDPVVDEGVHIKVFRIPFFGILEVVAVQHISRLGDVALDVGELLGGEVVRVRILDPEGDAVPPLVVVPVRVGPLDLVVIVEVQLEQVAAGDGVADVVLRRHLGDGHPVVVHPHLLDQQVRTHVLPVQDQLHRLAAGRPREVRHHRRHLHRHEVPHQGPVHEVRQQHPALVLVHPEDVLLLVQLDQIRFLGPVPGRIAAAADFAGRGVEALELLRSPDLQGSLHIRFLGSDGHASLGVDIDDGKAGPDGSGRVRLGEHPESRGLDHIFVPRGRIALDDGQAHVQVVVLPLPGILDDGLIHASFRAPDNLPERELVRLPAAVLQQFHFLERRLLVLHHEGKGDVPPGRNLQVRSLHAHRAHHRRVVDGLFFTRAGGTDQCRPQDCAKALFHRAFTLLQRRPVSRRRCPRPPKAGIRRAPPSSRRPGPRRPGR